MAKIKLSEIRTIIKKYHQRQKEFHRKEVNMMWKEVLELFNIKDTHTQQAEQANKTYCKFCNKWINAEEYNHAEQICIKCYNANVDDEDNA